MNITVMTYNIERGVHSRDHRLEEHRLLAIQRVVQQVSPDLLALTEACYGGQNSHEIYMDYSQLFGFPYSHFGSYPIFGPKKGDEGGNCLLSRLPMTAETIRLTYKSAVRARITLKEKILTLDVVHPSYNVTDKEKISTLTPLLATRKYPYLLTGDFNTIHPEDQYDFVQLATELTSFAPGKEELLVNNWRNPDFVSWLLEIGLQDAFPVQARESTVPTKYVYNDFRKGVRMDFFFISPDIIVENAYVIKNEDTEFASDHYPIVGKFEIE